MAETEKQKLGRFGEERVVKQIRACPSCKRARTLRRLRANFKCADIICDFCGYLAQVKAITAEDLTVLPSRVFGAGWRPQKDRMDAGIYFPLFLVLVKPSFRKYAIYYLPADLQDEEMFIPRDELPPHAKRAGWQGFLYDLDIVRASIVCLYPK